MKRFSSILVVIGGEPYHLTLTRAVALALENRASVTVIDVVAPLRTFFLPSAEVAAPLEMQVAAVSDRREELMQIASEYAATGVDIDVVVRVGNAAVEIVSQVIRGGHDLVIKTAHTQSGIQHALGSVTRALMRTCPCPVWAIKSAAGPHYHSILAAIDPQADDPEHAELNDQILEISSSLARAEGAALHLVSVWNLPMEQTLRSRLGGDACDRMVAAAERQVRQSLAELQAKHLGDGPPARLHLLRGSASEQIVAVAEQTAAELIVMGTVCRTGLSGLLIGNTAEHLLSRVTCGVLALKPRGFVSPIQATGTTSGQSHDV